MLVRISLKTYQRVSVLGCLKIKRPFLAVQDGFGRGSVVAEVELFGAERRLPTCIDLRQNRPALQARSKLVHKADNP
jgi:hypothetical protein